MSKQKSTWGTKGTLTAAIAAVAVVGAGAISPAAAVDAQAQLSPAEIVKKVEAKGYTAVHDVEFDDGRWELEATSPQGVAVDLTVDPATGEIVREEKD